MSLIVLLDTGQVYSETVSLATAAAVTSPANNVSAMETVNLTMSADVAEINQIIVDLIADISLVTSLDAEVLSALTGELRFLEAKLSMAGFTDASLKVAEIRGGLIKIARAKGKFRN